MKLLSGDMTMCMTPLLGVPYQVGILIVPTVESRNVYLWGREFNVAHDVYCVMQFEWHTTCTLQCMFAHWLSPCASGLGIGLVPVLTASVGQWKQEHEWFRNF